MGGRFENSHIKKNSSALKSELKIKYPNSAVKVFLKCRKTKQEDFDKCNNDLRKRSNRTVI